MLVLPIAVDTLAVALRSALGVDGARGFVVDSTGRILIATDGTPIGARLPARTGDDYAADNPAAASSWRTVVIASHATLLGPLEEAARSAWWIFAAFATAMLLLLLIGGTTLISLARLADPSRTQPFSPGFRMIAGDAKLQVPSSGNQFWCAGPGGQTGRSTDGNRPICAPTANLTYQLVFPDCWDGVHLDSPNHKDHVGRPARTAPAPAASSR